MISLSVFQKKNVSIRDVVPSWLDAKLRCILGQADKDEKEMIILGTPLRWTKEVLEYEAAPKHRRLILEHFGFEDMCKGSV